MADRELTAKELLLARAEANGYEIGAHREADEVRGREKYVSKTKKDQDGTLRRYVLWHLAAMRKEYTRKGLPPPDEETARRQHLHTGVAPLDLATVKDFTISTTCDRSQTFSSSRTKQVEKMMNCERCASLSAESARARCCDIVSAIALILSTTPKSLVAKSQVEAVSVDMANPIVSCEGLRRNDTASADEISSSLNFCVHPAAFEVSSSKDSATTLHLFL